MLKASHSLICSSCRLRAIIKTKQVARSRVSPVTRRAFNTASSSSKPPLPSSWTARKQYSTSTILQRARDPGFSRRQEVDIVEELFIGGHITRDEWRKSVWIQAGLKRDAEGHIADGGDDTLEIEDQVRRIHEWYSGGHVPAQLLDENESLIYERLFGSLRQIKPREREVGEDLGFGSGTGVLKESSDGVLEEVEFDDENTVVEEVPASSKKKIRRGNARLQEDIRAAMEVDELAEQSVEESEADADPTQRSHPLTPLNRFATSPTTINLPAQRFVTPVAEMLSATSNVHIKDAAHTVFGGPGLPYSTSTPKRLDTMKPVPIVLDSFQSQMKPIDADVYMAAIMPGVYSSVMGVLVEARKRLGTKWAENLVLKAEAGELRILDTGGAGAGALAVQELLRAEWERMHEHGLGDETPMGLAEVDGNLGGAGISAPTGKATVVVGSDTLKKRASKLLDNTTFIPRIPDYVHTEEARKRGKFDIIIAPHNLWPMQKDYMRKTHVHNLWSLLAADGGVLLLLEKGVARGFEVVAAARDLLLESRIASPGSLTRNRDVDEVAQPVPEPDRVHNAKSDEQIAWDDEAGVTADVENELEGTENHDAGLRQELENHRVVAKESGMIIAPCTNHQECPMYQPKGLYKGRRDVCRFEQRYHRPPFLQNIYGTKGKNHEDVEFSYLAVMRGRDLRSQEEAENDNMATQQRIQQNSHTRDRAFKGYESQAVDMPHSLTLPRLILPPLKRHGHVTMDVCTPAGTLERWTVPKSFSKQAYRDARQSSWGDLWALGAKTRVLHPPRQSKKRPGQQDEQVKDEKGASYGADEYGRITFDGEVLGQQQRPVDEGQRGRTRGKKVKGIRDKRDKKASGNGRRKQEAE